MRARSDWMRKARELYTKDKKYYSQVKLAQLFGKNVSQIWEALNPEKARERRRQKHLRYYWENGGKAQQLAQYYLRKHCPAFKARRAAANRRWRARQRAKRPSVFTDEPA